MKIINYLHNVLNILILLLVAAPVLSKNTSVDSSVFFTHPSMITAKINPNGINVAAIKIYQDKPTIVLIEPANKRETVLFDSAQFSKKDIDITELQWVDERFIAVQLAEIREGIEDLLDTKVSKRLLLIDTQNSNKDKQNVLSVRTDGWLVHPLPEEAGFFLYAKSGLFSKIYKLDANLLASDTKLLGKLDKIDGGQFTKSNEVRSNQGFALRWFINVAGSIKAVLNLNRKAEIELVEFTLDDKAEIIHTWDMTTKPKPDITFNNNLVPIAITAEANTYYCLDFNEEERKSVYKVNFKSQTSERVYETNAYKIIDLIQNEDQSLLGVVVLRDGAIAYEYIDSELKAVNQNNKEPLFSVYDTDLAQTHFIAYRESHNTAGQFLLLDKQKKPLEILGYVYPQFSKALNSTLLQGNVLVEGLTIPYLLNLPTDSPGPFPLIVFPHGGPIGIFDSPYFDLPTQYFVANGFAVLRVNFRGSGGISTEFRDAGKKQWGDLMLEDIYQATIAVRQRKEIDQQRICIVGMSYGGYAATMMLTQHPDLFQCGVNVAGVSDINLFLNSPQLSSGQFDWLVDTLGDPVQELDRLTSISPVYTIEKLQRPLLLAHGKKDRTVDVEHTYRLKLMLDKYNKDYTWYIDQQADHQFRERSQTQNLFNAVSSFLRTHLSPQ